MTDGVYAAMHAASLRDPDWSEAAEAVDRVEALLQKIANDEAFDNTATIEDATVFPEVAGASRTIGYAAKSAAP